MKNARSCSMFLALVVALSTVVGCAGSTDSADEAATEAARESVAKAAPVETDETETASRGLVSGGSSDGLFCTLCKAQGCLCSGNQCVSCGLTTR